MTYEPPKQCGTCTACCEGHLAGEAYGHKFSPGIPCHFLQQGKCTTYPTRPRECQDFFCGWVQGLFPDWMKPIESGVIVSVEFDKDKKQFLRVVVFNDTQINKIITFLDEWTKNNNTYYVIHKLQKVIPLIPI